MRKIQFNFFSGTYLQEKEHIQVEKNKIRVKISFSKKNKTGSNQN